MQTQTKPRMKAVKSLKGPELTIKQIRAKIDHMQEYYRMYMADKNTNIFDEVNRDGNLIQYVENPMESLIIDAINNKPSSFKYIKARHQTPKVIKHALRKDPNNLVYVKNQTEEYCLLAVKKAGSTIKYVHNQTEKIIIAALKNDISVLPFVDLKNGLFEDDGGYGIHKNKEDYKAYKAEEKFYK